MKFCLQSVIVLLTVGNASAFAPINNNAARTTTTQLAALSDKERVVVTGMGVINGCGIGHEEFFNNVCAGKSSIDRVKRFDITNYPCTIGSEVSDEQFDPKDYFTNPKNIKSNDRFTHFAVAASRQALKDAGVGDTPETLPNPERIGVMIGTAFGGMETFEQETLKLAKKPDRPKVRNMKEKYVLSRLSLKIANRGMNIIEFYLICFLFIQPHKTPGITLYYSSSVGKYSIRCGWY